MKHWRLPVGKAIQRWRGRRISWLRTSSELGWLCTAWKERLASLRWNCQTSSMKTGEWFLIVSWLSDLQQEQRKTIIIEHITWGEWHVTNVTRQCSKNKATNLWKERWTAWRTSFLWKSAQRWRTHNTRTSLWIQLCPSTSLGWFYTLLPAPENDVQNVMSNSILKKWESR